MKQLCTIGIILGILLVVVLLPSCVEEVAPPVEPTPKLESVGEQVVLSTVYWGAIGEAYTMWEDLVEFAASFGMAPIEGDEGYAAKLLNAELPGDSLIEMRMPMVEFVTQAPSAAEVQEAARELGLGTTFIRDIPSHQVMSITKETGVDEEETAELWDRLYAAIGQQGFGPAGPPECVFPDVPEIAADATFEDIEVILRVPVTPTTAAEPIPTARLESVEEQVVLSTVYWGPIDEAYTVWEDLVELAAPLGMTPIGDVGYLATFEDIEVILRWRVPSGPDITQLLDIELPGDSLIEMRMPVVESPEIQAWSAGEVQEAARELGLGTTFIRDIPSHQVMAVTKEKGVDEEEATELWMGLYAAIGQQGFRPAGPSECVLPDVPEIAADATFEDIEVILRVPVVSVGPSIQ